MALPELTLPPGTPAFSVENHDIEMGSMFADIPMRTGHHRRRRVYTTVPRVVSVKLDLTLAQMAAVHDWFEGPLQVGVQPFSAQVANQGPGLLWWKARFVEPYTAEADSAGQSFWVTAKLLLTGVGQVAAPYSPSMSAGVRVGLVSSCTLTVPLNLAAAVVIALVDNSNTLASSITVTLTSVYDGAAPSASQFEIRWVWQSLNYAPGRSLDVTDTQEFNQRSWMGL